METKKFEQTAMEIALKEMSVGSTGFEIVDLTMEDIVIVWKAKILKNHKAIITNTIPGVNSIVEVTYNGDTNEFYVDTYNKTNFSVIVMEDGTL